MYDKCSYCYGFKNSVDRSSRAIHVTVWYGWICRRVQFTQLVWVRFRCFTRCGPAAWAESCVRVSGPLSILFLWYDRYEATSHQQHDAKRMRYTPVSAKCAAKGCVTVTRRRACDVDRSNSIVASCSYFVPVYVSHAVLAPRLACITCVWPGITSCVSTPPYLASVQP